MSSLKTFRYTYVDSTGQTWVGELMVNTESLKAIGGTNSARFREMLEAERRKGAREIEESIAAQVAKCGV